MPECLFYLAQVLPCEHDAVNFGKFLITPFLQDTSVRMLLNVLVTLLSKWEGQTV